ncbi:MAG: hypothetical protein JXD19_05905 [Deltaproteobacteria bacterium]|nr:hypothetical protein [Deltaproteobacteria bacterium]
MNETWTKDDLEKEIERQNFVRAVEIAASLGLSTNEVRDLQFEALWQMAALNRNAGGTKILAQAYGVPKQELIKFLEDKAARFRENGDAKVISTHFDPATGKYFTFEGWVAFHIEKWKDNK